jgi:hypothetical protein
MLKHLKLGSPFLWFLVGLASNVGSAQAQPGTKPKVSTTDPANGATNVSRYQACIAVTFDTAINTSGCGMTTSNWYIIGQGSSSCYWSPDRRTMTYCRPDPTSNPLAYGSQVWVYLNPAVSPPWLADADGDFLDPYAFSFTIESPAGTGKVKVPANPGKGFSWPYYLYTPITVINPPVLMVEPNNTGTTSEDPAVHDQSASNLIDAKKTWADQLGVPYLVPTFPRPASDPSMYTHALDRKTIQATTPNLVRIDLQLMKMIEDARSRLAGYGINVDSKVFLAGASASGSFVSRFIMLHPETVKAASIGCPGWGPAVPVGNFNGQNLPYPEGVSDLQSLVGQPFNATAFRAIPLQVWVGDEDENVDPWWNLSDPTVALVNATFGGRLLYQRWPRYEAAYSMVTSMAQFVVFPQMAHQWADWTYMKDFFERNRSTPQPPLPKPQPYRLYFPHVASDGHWETEIALLNTIPGGLEVRGQLQAFGKAGGSPLEAMTVTIPPGGRKEITIGTAFHYPADIEYLVFLSDSGFIAGYTRFNEPGNRVSLPVVSAGVMEGWFPKMESDGWTGLAFVNIDTSNANVVLAAFDESGNKISETPIPPVKPGEKVVGLTSQLFSGTDLGRARYFCFTSDRNIIGFTISRSDDGLKLDGLMGLPRYLRTTSSEKIR